MVPLIDINTQLLQLGHQLLSLLKAGKCLVEAPLCHFQSDWQLEAPEINKVLWAPVSTPPENRHLESQCHDPGAGCYSVKMNCVVDSSIATPAPVMLHTAKPDT